LTSPNVTALKENYDKAITKATLVIIILFCRKFVAILLCRSAKNLCYDRVVFSLKCFTMKTTVDESWSGCTISAMVSITVWNIVV